MSRRSFPVRAVGIALAMAAIFVGLAFLASHGTVRPDVSVQSSNATGHGHSTDSSVQAWVGKPVEPHHQVEHRGICGPAEMTCLTAKTGIDLSLPVPSALADFLAPPSRWASPAPVSGEASPPIPDLAELSVLRI